MPLDCQHVFFVKMSTRFFSPFFDRVVCCWVVELVSSLCILEIKPLVISFANSFSHSVGFHCVLFVASFAIQKLVSLIRFHLFIFAFISIALGGYRAHFFQSIYLLIIFSISDIKLGLSSTVQNIWVSPVISGLVSNLTN